MPGKFIADVTVPWASHVKRARFGLDDLRNAHDCGVDSSMERQALPSDFHWDISALQESGVSIAKKYDPAQNLDFQAPRQAAILGTIGAFASARSSADN